MKKLIFLLSFLVFTGEMVGMDDEQDGKNSAAAALQQMRPIMGDPLAGMVGLGAGAKFVSLIAIEKEEAIVKKELETSTSKGFWCGFKEATAGFCGMAAIAGGITLWSSSRGESTQITHAVAGGALSAVGAAWTLWHMHKKPARRNYLEEISKRDDLSASSKKLIKENFQEQTFLSGIGFFIGYACLSQAADKVSWLSKSSYVQVLPKVVPCGAAATALYDVLQPKKTVKKSRNDVAH